MNQKKIELSEKRNGFSERDLYSKAILNTDSTSLLKYKIQKNRQRMISESNSEIERLKLENATMRTEIEEIKKLLTQITTGK